jgi:hypothetical protein
MAKGVEKSKLWDDLDPEENESTDTPTVTHEQTPTPTKKTKKKESTRTDTHTRTPKYAPAHLPTIGKGERKTERLQLLVRPSTKSRLAEYARDHGTSSNEVVQSLLDDLLRGY